MQIKIGDWVRVPSRKFDGPYRAAEVIKFEGVHYGCERVLLKIPYYGAIHLYPVINVEKITEEQAMLLIRLMAFYHNNIRKLMI